MEHTLSPQIPLLAHVLTVKAALARAFHVAVFLISPQNLVVGNNPDKLGIWKFNVVDRSLYGIGGNCVIVYATTLLG